MGISGGIKGKEDPNEFRRHMGMLVCGHGRPIRAKELRNWARSNCTEILYDDIWASGEQWMFGCFISCIVFQYDEAIYWGGHIALMDVNEKVYDWAGTSWHPEWVVQEYYLI